jgi:hypothetical protein
LFFFFSKMVLLILFFSYWSGWYFSFIVFLKQNTVDCYSVFSTCFFFKLSLFNLFFQYWAGWEFSFTFPHMFFFSFFFIFFIFGFLSKIIFFFQNCFCWFNFLNIELVENLVL